VKQPALSRKFHFLIALALYCTACASTPKYLKEDCPIYTEIETVRANPAGAPQRHLRLRAAFKVCPPTEGLAEIKRKRIEMKHHLIALLSSKTAAQLEDPLRVEKLQAEIMQMANEKVMKKSEAIEVFITDFELE
jgi:flagellar basal body-associated protein FliL